MQLAAVDVPYSQKCPTGALAVCEGKCDWVFFVLSCITFQSPQKMIFSSIEECVFLIYCKKHVQKQITPVSYCSAAAAKVCHF